MFKVYSSSERVKQMYLERAFCFFFLNVKQVLLAKALLTKKI